MDAPHALYVLLCLTFHDGTVVCEDPVAIEQAAEQEAEAEKDGFYDYVPDSHPPARR